MTKISVASGGRVGGVVEHRDAPAEEREEDDQRDDRPGQFEPVRAEDARRRAGRCAAAVRDAEVEHEARTPASPRPPVTTVMYQNRYSNRIGQRRGQLGDQWEQYSRWSLPPHGPSVRCVSIAAPWTSQASATRSRRSRSRCQTDTRADQQQRQNAAEPHHAQHVDANSPCSGGRSGSRAG